jgi:hypothetical protein
LKTEHRDDPRERQEEDDRGNQVRHEHRDADVLGRGQSQARQRVTRRHGGHERDQRDPRGDRHGVDDPGAVVGLVEEDLEVLERRRQVEPERDVVHPVEVWILLERGDQHPVDREYRHEHERREPGVDQEIAAAILLARGRDGGHG